MARDRASNSKLIVQLDRDTSALDAWRAVLSVLFESMQRNEVAMRHDPDPELLHDFRVAVRRTRSVLGQAKGIMARPARQRFRDDFAWVGRVSGPARDLDVHLLTLPKLQAGLSPARRDDLAPFGAFLERRRREARDDLAADLDRPRYTELGRDWQAFLDDPERYDSAEGGVGDDRTAAEAPDLPDAGRPASDVAGERTGRAHRRVIRHGRAIDDRSAPADLHELRKDAKKLRYLLECFGSLFPDHDLAPVVKELKGLQDVLGEIQDCHVQAASLEHFAQEMSKAVSGPDDGTPTATLLALGAVIERLERRERAARDAFAERFARFDAKAVRRRVRAAFRP
jgi:CHAD domain-containing protein